MIRFTSLLEFQAMLPDLQGLPFDDERVEFDTIADQRLTIKFNNLEDKSIIDEDGKTRELYQALVIENFSGFKILEPHDGTHYLKSVSEKEEDKYEFLMSEARWSIELDGNFEGSFGEMVDDTDWEFTLSTGTLLLGGLSLVGIGIAWFCIF